MQAQIVLINNISIIPWSPQANLIIIIASQVWGEYGVDELWISCGSNGEHSRGSLHYVGHAVDCDGRDLTSKDFVKLAEIMRTRLNNQFDVIPHDSHLHIEFQPKTPMNKGN